MFETLLDALKMLCNLLDFHRWDFQPIVKVRLCETHSCGGPNIVEILGERRLICAERPTVYGTCPRFHFVFCRAIQIGAADEATSLLESIS